MVQIKCKKCGEFNKSTAKFCKSCGADLSIKGNKCPKCGKINDFDNRFCEYCGSPMNVQEEVIEREVESKPSKKGEVKIVYANKKEVSSKPAEKSNEVVSNNGVKINYASGAGVKEHTPSVQLNDKANKYISLATRILFLVALLFVTIGIFGAFATSSVKAEGISESKSFNFTYFFKDLWDELKVWKDQNSNYGLTVFLNILHIGSYALLVIGVLYAIVVTLKCFIKDTKLETLPIKKVAKVLSVCAIPFLILTSMVYFGYIKLAELKVDSSYGWGTIFIIISLFCLVFADNYNELSKVNIIKTVINKIVNILMLVVVIIAFGNIFYFKAFGESIAYPYYALIQTNGQFGALMSFTLIALFLMLLFVILYFTRKNNKPRIVFNILLVVVSIALTILSVNVAKDFFGSEVSEYVSAAPACIVTIILTVISSILNIVSNRLENN